MKRDMHNQANLREEVLNDTIPRNNAPEIDEKPPVDRIQQALDDTRRVKVMSPGMLVFKRFMRSKLAIAGSIILIFMFSFAFLGGLISPYRQEQVFHKYDNMELDYAMASYNNDFLKIKIQEDIIIPTNVASSLNTLIKNFGEGETQKTISDSDYNDYILTKMGENAFLLEKTEFLEVVQYDLMSKIFTYKNESYKSNEFEAFIKQQIADKSTSTTYFSANYGDAVLKFIRAAKTFTIKLALAPQEAVVATKFVFDFYNIEETVSNGFKYEALKALYGSGNFDYEEISYEISELEDYPGTYGIAKIIGEEKISYANVTDFVVRRYTGENTLSVSYKLRLQKFVSQLQAESKNKGEFSYFEENGVEIPMDENGDIKNIYKVEKKLDDYVIRNEQTTYLIDIFSPPSAKHWLGTDANGMDVLTRMMYGGRISLLIGFIVIIIETLLGVILGGIAGYFGKWIDNIIMRIVDIFNCLPFLPILIILGSVFDKLQLGSYDRIMYLMIILGVLGWPSVARLVRGQILSLREQEFMIAAEATGISAKRRIFRHLIPNVMPQLIVTSTMGLGGIIITESTLSFLGLGAKYPLATWGSMINSVSDASSLLKYTYIWIPVGLLICLTVIAFNFVGDGLRDAFDPKMKR